MSTSSPRKISRGNWMRVAALLLAFVAGSQSGPVSDWAKKLMESPLFQILINDTQVSPNEFASRDNAF